MSTTTTTNMASADDLNIFLNVSYLDANQIAYFEECVGMLRDGFRPKASITKVGDPSKSLYAHVDFSDTENIVTIKYDDECCGDIQFFTDVTTWAEDVASVRPE